MNRLLPYLQLVRLPNVFTAWADILLAALVTGAALSLPSASLEMQDTVFAPGLAEYLLSLVLLLLASSCLYAGGMVWNDYFDIEQDEKERPHRPLPSGRVPLSTAFMLAALLTVLGVVCAVFAGFGSAGFRWSPGLIAVVLAGTILLYDGVLKRTWAGPVAMGACRFLNVLLGLSIVSLKSWGLLLALVVGVYIAGVTWFARTEARESNRSQLLAAAGVMLLALFLAVALPAAIPVERDPETNLPASTLVWWGQLLFPYLLAGFALLVGLPVYRAIQHPIPGRVQPAVKRLVLGLVLLDAVLAVPFAGPPALLLALLLVPAMYLGRWVYST